VRSSIEEGPPRPDAAVHVEGEGLLTVMCVPAEATKGDRSMSETVLYEVSGAVATITLNRREAMNTMGEDLLPRTMAHLARACGPCQLPWEEGRTVLAMDLEFGDALRTRLTMNLRRHDRLAVDLDQRRHAAVAVVVVDSDARLHGVDTQPVASGLLAEIPAAEDLGLTGSVAGTAGGPAVLLTRRATRMRAHAGQWALPGGRLDGAETPIDAARRELHEELDLQLPESVVMGLLDDYPTRSGYVITPVVVWGGADPRMRPHPDEVASVHRIAFRELCRDDSPRFVTIPESDRPVVQLPIGRDLVHAPTGAVLLQFRRVAIEGTSERVSGYEQPVFAWR
jgi:8-oxo-dGTP pyrophosphatase MutT (NUDIX family)